MKPEENSEALVAADPSAAPAVPSALDIALPVASEPEPAAHVPRRGWGYWLREWVDAIVIAYVLAMFIRAFGLELYKIPSGSMTPTLVGDEVAEVDFNNDGARDLLVLKQAYQGPNSQLSGGKFQVFLRNGPDWEQREEVRLVGAPFEKVRPFLRTRYDRILVNKFAY
ncbi:MAG: S26 family signal peptidase, partial [Candidatus Sumerlaeota bacterium]|nr:S26 family signal peptidase [Candidatus Sumerlaeota bacterium]